mgnify:CR=1 FL=1
MKKSVKVTLIVAAALVGLGLCLAVAGFALGGGSTGRSGGGRVGEEGRSRGAPDSLKKKKKFFYFSIE